MKNLILILFLIPGMVLSQRPQSFESEPIPNYDSDHTFLHICHGEIGLYLRETVTFTKEKKNNRWVISEIERRSAIKKVNKIFSAGAERIVWRSADGYCFIVEVSDKIDHTKVINFVKFQVDPRTRMIGSIEIHLGTLPAKVPS